MVLRKTKQTDAAETLEELQKAQQIQSLSPVDPGLELLDPNPNIHQLFQIFDKQFFWGKLVTVEVKWSPRMTTCAGICRYQTRSGYCTIGLSKPLLSLRPRKDLVETLLHEMIHALLFVTHNNRDRDGHGPEFHKHMFRINGQIGSKISVYHTFHDEVRAQKVHVWRCEGVCKDRPPFYGYVRRSMNRAPNAHDLWHPEHLASCGGTFTKILEPPNFKSKKNKKSAKDNSTQEGPAGTPKITTLLIKSPDKMSQFPPNFTAFSGSGVKLGSQEPKKEAVKKGPASVATPKITSMFEKSPVKISQLPSNFTPFAGSGFRLGSNPSPATSSKTAVITSPATSSKTAVITSSATSSKTAVITSSPKKRQHSSKDISSFFTKSSENVLNFSDDDSDLLILSPPSKRKRLDPPQHDTASPSKKNPTCPICGKSGFADLNIHANMCLNSQMLEYSQRDSQYNPANKIPAPITILDDSIEAAQAVVKHNESDSLELLEVSGSSGGRGCPICGKSISSDLNKHLKICIESIPDDEDEDWREDNKPSSSSGNVPKLGKTHTTKESSASTVTTTDNTVPLVNVPDSVEERVCCPICSRMFEQAKINSHLDDCLSFNLDAFS